jgi:hypothetical protein
MKKLTKEEAQRIPRKPVGRNTLVRTYLLNMQPGDIIFLERHEWTWQSHQPSYICHEVARTKRWRFTCEQALDKSGWVIERVK